MVAHPGQASTLIYQAGMDAYMLDGRDTISTLSLLKLGCPLGYELKDGSDFARGVCWKCEKGFYLNDTDLDECTRCELLDNDFLRASCDCHFGYTGDRCSINQLARLIGVLLAVVVVIGLCFCGVYRVRKHMRSLKYDVELSEKLLAKTNQELKRLESVWQIQSSEVDLLKKIDKGAQGEVWLGQWQGREVAVKRMHQHLVELEHEAIEEFEHEVNIMRSIRHNNIVFFFGWGMMQNTPFLVAEFMQRGSVKKLLLDRDDWPWGFKLKMCLDTACGLHYLHVKKHIHRDIKSANLLVSHNWVTKIGDFGTARLASLVTTGRADKSRAYTMNSTVSHASSSLTRGVGTLFWSAPEVLETQPYNSSADIYSFGIVMVEMIVRRRYPYEDDIAELPIWSFREAVCSGTRPPLPTQTGAPDGFIGLLMQCQKGDAKTRPTARQAVTTLEELLQETPEPSPAELNALI
eukprot:TRINITY_DN11986_c0_g1_i6.p1 TRINITY_DN11986_c0_g1~~TRINITY_DN11986_c0_g1_i6.p1  ORF type:complete len:463 (+),score=112.21 TRINITY_DN11986_c0_g1_i6:2-1390(+)